MAGYGTDTAFADWLAIKGRVLPAGAAAPAVLRELGSAYIDGLYYARFPGRPTGGAAQERQWPRTGASDRWGNAIPSDAIPERVAQASYEAAWIEGNQSGALSTTYTPGMEKVLTQVENIRWQIVNFTAGEQRMVLVSSDIEGLLGPLLTRDDLSKLMVV